MDEKFPGYKLVPTAETDSEVEFDQLPPTPDMSPIIRTKPKPIEFMPRFLLS